MTLILSGTDGLSDIDGTASTPAIRGTDANTGIFFPAADTIAFAEGGAEAARFDSAGRLLIGQTSPYDNATLSVTSPSQVFSVVADGGLTGNRSRGGFLHPATNVFAINADQGTGVLAFYQNGNTERARIDTSGNLLVGTTAATPNPGFAIYPSGGFSAGNSAGSTGFEFATFRRSAVQIGSITQNGTTAVLYNTSSDYRLKHDINPMTGALAKVALLKPVTYKWNSDSSDGEGFIAHELQEVCPGAVAGEKDAVNEDGSIKPQGIDTSFLVATLTAAIQEQQQMIETLQAKVAALEAKG